MPIPERCLRCDWWNHNSAKCDRVFKARMRITDGGGEILFETQPGLLPKDMEEELGAYLVTVLQDFIDAWPGWKEINRIKQGGKICAGEQPNQAIKEYGRKLKLAEPLKNLDANGLFKSDISLI